MEEILKEIANTINNQKKNILIGISGHGASGKTTFAEKLIEHIEEKANFLNTDPYIITDVRKYATINYEYENIKHSYKMTACNPEAHNLLALNRDVKMLRDGLDLYTIETDYSKSTLLSSKNKINIIEGMSVAFLNPDLFDLTIYLYCDGETELQRRGIRDISERGRSMENLKKSHQQRRIQYDLFMHPYSKKFDVIIKNSNEDIVLEKYSLFD